MSPGFTPALQQASRRLAYYLYIYIDKKLQEPQEMQQTYHDISHCNLVHFASQRIISLLSSSLIYLRNLAGAELVQAEVQELGIDRLCHQIWSLTSRTFGLQASHHTSWSSCSEFSE